jgi:hypothetical protein
VNKNLIEDDSGIGVSDARSPPPPSPDAGAGAPHDTKLEESWGNACGACVESKNRRQCRGFESRPPIEAPRQVFSPSPDAGVDADADGAACRYTASGPAVEAASRLEKDGRPGYMHLSLAAADRLGAERGLFMELGSGPSWNSDSDRTTPETSAATSAADLDAAAGGGAEPPPLPPPGTPPPPGSPGARAPRHGGGGAGSGGGSGGMLRHERSVWIDCFGGDLAEALVAAANEPPPPPPLAAAGNEAPEATPPPKVAEGSAAPGGVSGV